MNNTTGQQPILVSVGHLSAWIPGDYRYSDTLRVHYDPTTDTVRVRVFTTGAVGGMDSGRSDSYEPTADFDASTKQAPKAKEVVDLVKRAMTARSHFLLKKYGKPSKNFRWCSGEEGLSVARCDAALKVVRQRV